MLQESTRKGGDHGILEFRHRGYWRQDGGFLRRTLNAASMELSINWENVKYKNITLNLAMFNDGEFEFCSEIFR